MADLLRFPAWLSVTHYLNILFLVFLGRSGLQILASFPRLYLRDDCMPGREVLKFTKRRVPRDRLHQSLDEELDVSPWLGLPGGRGGLGSGRHWHFAVLGLWVATGLVYVALLFATGQWRRLVPTSFAIVPGAVQAAGAYLHFELPREPAGYPYNPLQQLAYFLVVFGLAPLQIATGAAMSPAVIGRFPWYPRLFGGRQAARTLHFAGLVAFAAFVVVHTAMVVVHGLPREVSRIVLGSENADPRLGLALGLLGLALVAALAVLATLLSRRSPRAVQRSVGRLVEPLQGLLSHRLRSRQRYRRSDISRHFWVNGYPPADPFYRQQQANDFAGWTVRVGGLVERQFDLTLEDLRDMPAASQVTKHNCIQGWTGVAEWRGVPLSSLIERCRPLPGARYVVFYGRDVKGEKDGAGDGIYYETLDLELARAPQSLLAYEMNGRPLPVEHGAPLRLRVESQLGFKMVKWVEAIAFVQDFDDIGLGQGGWREDHLHYGRLAGI